MIVGVKGKCHYGGWDNGCRDGGRGVVDANSNQVGWICSYLI